MLNKVVFQGRFCAEPEIRYCNDFALATFTIAWSERYKETETTCFLKCKAWRSTAEFIGKYFKKGQECIIEGKLETETWETDGQKRSAIVCNVDKIHFCGSKNSTSTNENKADDGFMNIPDGIPEELPFN